MDFVGDSIWGWSSIGGVELDAKISIWTTWVVASCQQYTPICFVFPDHAGNSRGREDSILAHYEF